MHSSPHEETMLIRRNTVAPSSRTQVPSHFTCSKANAPAPLGSPANQLSPRLSYPDGVLLIDFCDDDETGTTLGRSMTQPPGPKNAQNCARGVALGIPVPRSIAHNPFPDRNPSQPLGLHRVAPSASDLNPLAAPAAPSASSPVAAGSSFRRKAPAALLVQSRNARAADVSKELQCHSAPSNVHNSVCGPLSAPARYRRKAPSPLSHPPRGMLPEEGRSGLRPSAYVTDDEQCIIHDWQGTNITFVDGTTGHSPGPPAAPGCGLSVGVPRRLGHARASSASPHGTVDQSVPAQQTARWTGGVPGAAPWSPLGNVNSSYLAGGVTAVPGTPEVSVLARHGGKFHSPGAHHSKFGSPKVCQLARGMPASPGAPELSVPARSGGKFDSPRAHHNKLGSPKEVERRGKQRLDPWDRSTGAHTGASSAWHPGWSGAQGQVVPADIQTRGERAPMAYPVDPPEVLVLQPRTLPPVTKESSSPPTRASSTSGRFPDFSSTNSSVVTGERFTASGRCRTSREQREGALLDRGLFAVEGRGASSRRQPSQAFPTLVLSSPKATSSSPPETMARDPPPLAEGSPSRRLPRRSLDVAASASCSTSPLKSSLKAVNDIGKQKTQQPSPRRVSFSEDVRVRKFVPCNSS